MTTTTLSPVPLQAFRDNNGNPLAGGKVFTYQAGTTTKLVTYADSTGVTPNSDPIILNYRGEAQIWVPPNTAYKFVLAPSTDTDPPTNPIWSVDQITNSQLITLYGGVDLGAINAYLLTFVANFTSYVDGTVIYFIPSHNNTGASTINVNGLGVVSITNQDGTALSANQLQANQTAVIMFKGGAFLLLSSGNVPLSGTFSVTLSSVPATPITVSYYRVGQQVTLRAPGTTGASSAATTMVMNGLIAAVTPVSGASALACLLTDNGLTIGGWGVVNAGSATITFGTGINNNASGFTPSTVRGLAAGWTLTYSVG